MSEKKKLRVAILWHMHQPYYLNPDKDRLLMPWVRLHGLKDYLDMPLLASEYDNVRVTFNLVPSLLDQIQLYAQGVTDRHLELSRIPARNLQRSEKREILDSFFSAHYPRMIEPYPRFRQLFRKKESCGSDLDLAVDIFSSFEWRDLQVWSNLVWIDPMFRGEEPVKELFEKGRDFAEDDKEALLDFQMQLLARIIPAYQRLYREGRIDVSFTPYYHPILPLLIDTDEAREAIPEIELPRTRFTYPGDAEWHIRSSVEKFNGLFDDGLTGMWPSEGSVSEATLKLIEQAGIGWAASDQEVLHFSLLKSGLDPRKHSPHTVYNCAAAPGVKLLFRDRGLSDKIGFVYSGWEPEKAVGDFIANLKEIRKILTGNLEQTVVPIILDGENAWEYFADDGLEFLRLLYRALSTSDEIETVFCREAVESIRPTELPSLYAGSWINHNFRVWIGHSEDNSAWELLHEARQAIDNYEKKNASPDTDRLDKAYRQIHVAEGSDWCWWYGDEHISEHNAEFDELYRLQLGGVYDALGLDKPAALSRPIFQGKTESFLILPESLLTPRLDGRLTHYYEWSGAGSYHCARAGQAMHRTDRILERIYFGYDHQSFYIRLDFTADFDLNAIKDLQVVVNFNSGGLKKISLGKDLHRDFGDYEYIFKNILETRFDRRSLLGEGGGRIEFFVSLQDGDKVLENWPPDDPIVIDIPEREKEIFWQV